MGTHPIFESDFDCLTVLRLMNLISGTMDWLFSMPKMDQVFYLAWGMIGNAAFVAPLLTFVLPAYYGRYTTTSWLPINAKVSWVVQESPAFFIPAYLLWNSPGVSMVNSILISMMCVHYFQRSFIYSLLMRSKNKVPVSVTFFAFVFCTYNGYMQGTQLCAGPQKDNSWLTSPNFIIGVGLFLAGMFGNIQSDAILRNLRKPGESGYKIPRGGVFEYVSAANYFCETIEWTGFALACSNFSAAAFAFYTMANLLPRALSHHKWYQEKFKEDYPKERKAFLPFLL